MESGEKILEKLEGHDTVLHEHTEQLEFLATKLVEHDAKLADHDNKLDRLISTQIEHGVMLKELKDQMVTKTDLREMIHVMEAFAGKTNKVEEEQIFIGSRLDHHTEDIKNIKLQLKTA